MPVKARAFIHIVAIGGSACAAFGLATWSTSNATHYVIACALALLTSTLKVRVPRMTGTMSANFLLILVASVEFSFGETVVMALACVPVQAYWKAKRRPVPAQLIFNLGALAISASLAHALPRLILDAAGVASLLLHLAVAVCVFYLANSLLVTTVVALVERKPYNLVWRPCYLWSFPYYLVGAGLASLVCAARQSAGWAPSLLVLPLMYLVYMFYRYYVESSTSADKGHAVAA